MIDVRTEREHDVPGRLTKASKLGFHNNPRLATTQNGGLLARLEGRVIELFDITGSTPVLKYRRTLNDLKETVGNGPWLKCQPNAYNQLALSSDGSMLAISQERTIQIYDLLADEDSFTVNEYISSASGHYICGVEFEQNDHVLRVQLSGKGTVLYLGTPPAPGKQEEKANVHHWKSREGLKHTFLDSSLLEVEISPAESEAEQKVRVCGVQLLQPFEDGWLFAGQHHGRGESSLYILGHVRTSVANHTHAATVEPQSVTVLARLESFLSSWRHTLEAANDEHMGLWENMPSAHEHHPRFAMASNGNVIALAERDKKRIRSASLTQIFIYRLPSQKQLHNTLAKRTAEMECSIPRVDRTEGQAMYPKPSSLELGLNPKHDVARIPLCLTTMQGDVLELKVEPIVNNSLEKCSVSASTADTTMRWTLEDW